MFSSLSSPWYLYQNMSELAPIFSHEIRPLNLTSNTELSDSFSLRLSKFLCHQFYSLWSQWEDFAYQQTILISHTNYPGENLISHKIVNKSQKCLLPDTSETLNDILRAVLPNVWGYLLIINLSCFNITWWDFLLDDRFVW